MYRFHILLLTVALASPSCDKLTSISKRFVSAVKGKAASAEVANTTPDPVLQKSVDTTLEGVIFRKDLPFPNKLKCTITARMEMDARCFNQSELGSSSADIKGTTTAVTELERNGDEVRYTLKESAFKLPLLEGEDADETKPAVTSPIPIGSPETILFKKSRGTWGAAERDFRAMARSKEIAPFFEELLIDHCLSPRSLWFGKRRFKAGDQISINNSTMAIARSKNSTGSLTLVFEKVEAVNGHPCGVFSVKGNYSDEKSAKFSGTITSSEISIESGKIWFSLLYPMVMKEDLQTIVTERSGSSGGATVRTQGKIHATSTADWRASTSTL